MAMEGLSVFCLPQLLCFLKALVVEFFTLYFEAIVNMILPDFFVSKFITEESYWCLYVAFVSCWFAGSIHQIEECSWWVFRIFWVQVMKTVSILVFFLSYLHLFHFFFIILHKVKLWALYWIRAKMWELLSCSRV